MIFLVIAVFPENSEGCLYCIHRSNQPTNDFKWMKEGLSHFLSVFSLLCKSKVYDRAEFFNNMCKHECEYFVEKNGSLFSFQ